MKKALILLIILTTVSVSMGLRQQETPTLSSEPFEKLSDYHLFDGELNQLKPAKGVLPYDLNSPLFTDYAYKARFVYIPAGKSAVYNDSTFFDFPEGSIIVKNFYYPVDFRQPKGKRKIIETRLLIKGIDSWTAFPYIWNDEQTEAILELAGDTKKVSWVHYDGSSRGTDNYFIPNVNECKGCHANKRKIMPIGPTARNLNGTFEYVEGKMNQLAKWTKLGILKGAPEPDKAPRLATWDDPKSGTIDQRARAWLEINCAHCHNPQGPAGTSGLDLRALQNNPLKYGICKIPIAAGMGSGNHKFDILPGQADKSILVYRMETNEPGQRMPEIGRSVVHVESMALIKEWINQMPQTNCNDK